ncbi:hypothetical protein Unana1_01000 [Umbelopsis nana]
MSNLETSNPETNHETNNNISPPGSHEKIPVDNGTTTVVDIHQPAMVTVAPNKQPPQIDKEKPKDVPSKPGLAEKLKSMLPTYNQFKKTLKADIALTVALVLVLDQTTNESIGQGTLLASIAMVFFCPVKPIGLQFETVILSCLGVLLSAGWSILGMFLANLSRDHTNPSPLQTSNGAILAIFLFIGTFFFNWMRSAYPKTNFAGILGCIVLIFAMTTSAAVPIFEPIVVWTFVIPIAIGAGLAMAVDILIWPEDTANNCIAMFQTTLNSFNTLLTQQTEVFLQDPDLALPQQATPLSVIHNNLQGNILMLIESKRAVQREIFYSKLTAKDFSYLTKLVKSMRVPLHGIGLSRCIEQEMYDAQTGGTLKLWQTTALGLHPNFNDSSSVQSVAPISDTDSSFQSEQLIQEYKEILNILRPICNTLASECTSAVSECMSRLNCLHNGKRNTPGGQKDGSTLSDDGEPFTQRLRTAIESFEKDRTTGMDHLFQNRQNQRDLHRALLLLLSFQYNLRLYAEGVLEMAEYITTLEKERCKKGVCWPNITFQKWIKGASRADDITANGNQLNEGNADRQLERSASRINYQQAPVDISAVTSAWEQHPAGRYIRRDPDVLAPSTGWERFFYGLYKFKVVVYRYNYVLEGNPEPVWMVAGTRCLLVVIGVIAASIMYCIPFPITGRVELRYRLAQTVRDIGTLYSTLIYAFEKLSPDSPITEKQRKKFQKLALDIQRQIALERILLAHAKYEPPLRGKYPQAKYAKILDHVDNMADMIFAMGSSIENLSPVWREDLTRKVKQARNTYVATVMTGFKLVTAALAAKTSFPPYLHYPKDALAEFGDIIRQLPSSECSYLNDPAFTVFAAYFLNSSAFVMELQKLIETTQDLVGVDMPSHWMELT